MLKSMQTHFEGTIGDALCAEIVSKGIEHFRLSGMNSTHYVCTEMLNEARLANADPLLIISDHTILSDIANCDIEWGNEPDGDMLPRTYHESFMKAYEICQVNGNRLHGPAISNLDMDSLRWLEAFIKLGIPGDVVITYHHYTPDMFFWQSHQGFEDRDHEMRSLKNIAWGRDIACSESGYNDTNESRVEENVAKEIEFGIDK